MALGLILGLGRSMRRKRTSSLDILSSKRAPRDYYKGKNCKPTGFHTRKASSCSSPTHRYGFSFSEAKGSMSFLRSSKNVLMKSRSVAFVPRMRGGEGKKKGGFWSKLLHPRRKGTDEVLVHSRTVRERVTS
ncbi:hypothetical protein L1049_025428 [Liquidambar formosana]|uniref:Uncharacterized protein n=1 Tax=Liquidambar formosana TaxID=63359 RepID=A0AAP0NDM9_LIQFO